MFVTYFLTILPILVGGGNFLRANKCSKDYFLSKDYTTALKGLCCLVVIYVHIKEPFENSLQDIIGSFAYVCVTLFFLFSAYGMLKSVESNESYLKSFWRNRLVALLIPCCLINIVSFGLGIIDSDSYNWSLLYHLNGYVAVLLQWCIWFYLVEKCRIKWFRTETSLTDAILIVGVIVSSLYYYYFVEGEVSALSGWCFERMGLVWGVLLYRYHQKIVSWMDAKRWGKVAVMVFIGGILGIMYLKYKYVYFWGAYLLKIALGFVLISLLFAATSNRQLGNKFSLWLGDISYEVYLSHGLVMGTLALYFPIDMNVGWFLFATVLITLALSTCVHLIGKPIINKFRNTKR